MIKLIIKKGEIKMLETMSNKELAKIRTSKIATITSDDLLYLIKEVIAGTEKDMTKGDMEATFIFNANGIKVVAKNYDFLLQSNTKLKGNLYKVYQKIYFGIYCGNCKALLKEERLKNNIDIEISHALDCVFIKPLDDEDGVYVFSMSYFPPSYNETLANVTEKFMDSGNRYDTYFLRQKLKEKQPYISMTIEGKELFIKRDTISRIIRYKKGSCIDFKLVDNQIWFSYVGCGEYIYQGMKKGIIYKWAE